MTEENMEKKSSINERKDLEKGCTSDNVGKRSLSEALCENKKYAKIVPYAKYTKYCIWTQD